MREIRFRGRSIGHKTPGEWVYGYFAKTYCPIYDNDPHAVDGTVTGWNEDCEIFNCEPGHRGDGYWTRVDPDTIGQDTGFSDSLGTPIYESDELFCRYALNGNPDETMESRVTVYWDGKRGCFSTRETLDDGVEVYGMLANIVGDENIEVRVINKD